MLQVVQNHQGMSPRANAGRVLAEHWDGRLPVDPGVIAEGLGIRLVPVTTNDYSGYFTRDDEFFGGPVIRYNREDPLVRKRFTVAHEIGHFVLGHDNAPRDNSTMFGTSVREPIERAANQFAAELLMPADAVRKVALSGKFGSVDELADAFKVSKVAMNYRLTNLRLTAW